MTALLKNPVFRVLSDLRLAAILLAAFAVASGAATWIESYYAGIGSTTTGRAAAYDLVYDAPWFNALLILLTVNLLLNLVRRLARGRVGSGSLLVHVGMIIILIGAGVTRWFGWEGYLRIREGERNNVIASAEDHVIVRAGDQQAEIPVRLYRPGDQRIRRGVDLGGRALTLGVAEYWPHYETAMVPGEGGRAMVTLGVMGHQGLEMHTLYAGDEEQIGGVLVRFHPEGLPPLDEASSRYGDLRVRAGGEVCRLPIRPVPGLLGTCGGFQFELMEFQSDFHTESDADPEGPLLNPMVRIVVTGPDGASARKTLFALHPDFVLAQENQPVLQQVDLLYELSAGVDLAVQDGRIVLRAPFPLERVAMSEGGESRTLAAGEVAPLQTQMLYRAENGLRLVPSTVERSVVSRPTASANPNAPAAARLFVEQDGQRAEAVCVLGDAPQRVELNGQALTLTYGSVLRTLPYEIYLEDFILETYPGSDNPASYESHVVLEDPARGISGRNVRIWMNHPLTYRGTKHFQSSYDRDRLGTVLSVNRDPGKYPTYVGYTIFSLGFLIVMGQVIRDRARAGRTVAAALVALSVVGLGATAVRAQTPPPATPPTVLNLSPAARAEAARLTVQDFRGRMKPLDTLAQETVMKVAKRSRFEGRDPVEVFLGMAVNPGQWYHHPLIEVKNPGVQDLLGVSHDVHHVSLATVLAGGEYKLQDAVEEAHRTAPNQRTKTQQKLIVFDERVHILYDALQGNSLRIFPLPDDPGHRWENIQKVLEALPESDSRHADFKAAGDALFLGLAEGDAVRIAEGLRRTAALQQLYGAGVMPADQAIKAELALNRLHPFARATLPYLASFVLLIIAYFVGLFRREGRPWSWKHPLYAAGMLFFVAGFALHLYGFVLRWIASGRAPLSNGHESLLFIALAVALAGLVFEMISRTAAAGALGPLLTSVVLGVAMMGDFDPAIGPLVPVLASYWLNIHVTIITASYGFLGLSCLLGMLTLVLFVVAGVTRRPVAAAVAKLDKLNVDVMIAGLGLLAIGTLLGGVWANESWGRYWGWDPKETWALVSVLLYAVILHFRWIPRLANAYVQAAWSFMAIWSIIMTYFGVNYLLVGLHSYAAGEAARIPVWVLIAFVAMGALAFVAYFAWRDSESRRPAAEGLAPKGQRA